MISSETLPPTVSLVAIGDELTNGKISDTNSSYIARELRVLGIEVKSIGLVGDSVEAICEELRHALRKSSVVICTGGLGPTSDDRTRDAIASLCGTPLVEDQASLERMKQYCLTRNRPLNKNNLQQVYFPEGARVIENTFGTADAFEVHLGEDGQVPRFIIALPGVPREMKGLLAVDVLPRLQTLLPSASPTRQHSFRIFGIPESLLGEKIDALSLPDEVIVSYRPQFPEILLELCIRANTASAVLEECSQRVKDCLSVKHIISETPQQTLSHVVTHLLSTTGKTVACAESCSGGLLADSFVAHPGSSTFFLGSIVAYHNQVKESLLGVPQEVLEQHGAVSEACCLAMAHGARERTGADYALAITGIAGPEGGTDLKPVGTIWTALASATGASATLLQLHWDREMNRRFASAYCLDWLRQHILTEHCGAHGL